MTETIHADMSASVWRVLVNPGDLVDEGEPLILLESMKMEIPVIAESSAVVVSLRIQEGDIVNHGQPLIDLATD
jgi:biotin carboxyl carrier protein